MSHSSRCLAILGVVAQAHASRFVILRHGQTNHNAAGIIQGSSDASRLTEKGVAQAERAGESMASLTDALPFDRVFVSSNTRAQQTLDALRKFLPDLPPATVCHNLREIDLGSWEGMDKAVLKAEQPEAYRAWQSDPLNFIIDDGALRPVVDLWERASNTWDELRDGETEGMRALVVSHNACGQALLCTALGLDASHFRRFEFDNCAAIEVAFGGDAKDNGDGLDAQAGGEDEPPPRWRDRLGPRAQDPPVWRDRTAFF